jgi:hypothetical protein
MTSDALTYLKDQTVRWINLDRSPERRVNWENQIAPLFKRAIRVTATDWRVIPDEAAAAFIKEWNEQYVRHQLSQSTVFMHEPQSPSRFRMSTAKANCAIRGSHLRALRDAIAVNTGERILIAEDDIAPRNALWTERIDLPPADADMAIWSGGLPMAAVRTDDKVYQSGDPFRWVPIRPEMVFNTLGAGLYDLTPMAAVHLVNKVTDTGGSWDHAWGYALRDMIVYRLRPNAFPQSGPSVRNGVNRTPITERTKVKI